MFRPFKSCAVLCVFAAAGSWVYLASREEARSVAVTPPADPLRNARGIQESSSKRPDFRYSVVRGGVQNVSEVVAAVREDKLVAEHYARVRTSHLKPVMTEAPAKLYVSYRKQGRIYWTSKPVSIPAGEKVLTDGQTTIRARCGNLLATEPQQPVYAPAWEAPRESEFDQTGDPPARIALSRGETTSRERPGPRPTAASPLVDSPLDRILPLVSATATPGMFPSMPGGFIPVTGTQYTPPGSKSSVDPPSNLLPILVAINDSGSDPPFLITLPQQPSETTPSGIPVPEVAGPSVIGRPVNPARPVPGTRPPTGQTPLPPAAFEIIETETETEETEPGTIPTGRPLPPTPPPGVVLPPPVETPEPATAILVAGALTVLVVRRIVN